MCRSAGIQCVECLRKPAFITGSLLGEAHHGNGLAARSTLHFLSGQDPALLDKPMEHRGRIGQFDELTNFLESQAAPEPQGLDHLETPIIKGQFIKVFRFRGKLQFGLARQTHPGGQGGQRHLTWATTVMGRHPVPEPQGLLGKQWCLIEQGQVGFRLMLRPVSVDTPDHRRVEPFSTQRNHNPAPRTYRTLIPHGDCIGEQAGQGQRKDDIHIQHGGRKYPKRTHHVQLARSVEPHPQKLVSSSCII